VRYVFGLLAVLGIVLSSLALREHYRTEDSPCHINDVWDCGEVNHSPYASLLGVPVAVIGIAGYFGLGILGMMRAWRVVLVAAVAGLAFSLYLTHVEKDILRVWCIYCVGSLGVITLTTMVAIGINLFGGRPEAASAAADSGRSSKFRF
jgi:vitamin-K-epoxide reductase (warfarin-sensitive)